MLSLLGVAPEAPVLAYDATGTIYYTFDPQVGEGTFEAEGTPLFLVPTATGFSFVGDPRIFQINVRLDGSGGVTGGVAGDDLFVDGLFDRDGDGNFDDVSGPLGTADGIVDDFDVQVLVTGEVTQFGSLDTGTSTDQFDFRFTPTGGVLVEDGFFDGKDIGVTMVSTNSTFTGDFQTNFTGFAQGALGPIGPLAVASLSGIVFVDFNNDGEINFGENALSGVTVTLTGTDDLGNAVNLVETTDLDGAYFFTNLQSGTYTITETQPAGLADGIDTLGSAGGILGNDVFSAISLGAGADGINYNFGERALDGGTVGSGTTATIGFWQNKNGQALIKSLNGSETSAQLGNWLAASFSNMYGSTAGDNNLAGKTNAEVASFFRSQFKVKRQKLDAQVMAVALATYVTNSTLAGNVAVSYGFNVTADGLGASTFNVGESGAAFGVANNTTLSIMDILLSTDEQALLGVLYNSDAFFRSLAIEVYSGINEAGDI